MTNVRVTPLNDNLIENGIYPSEKFDHATLRKCNWPKLPGHRTPEGGTGGEYFGEDVKVVWKNDKLIFPVGEIEIPIAERNEDQITYFGSFVAQLDSDIAYYPEKHFVSIHSKDFLIFVCCKSTTNDTPIFRAIHVPHGYGIVVEANVAHSMPIPIHTNHVDFKVYHRSVNSVAQFNLTNPLNVNIKDLDESTTITVLKAVCEDEEEEKGRRSKSPTKKIRLPLDFSSELLHAHPANASNFKEYGKIIENVHEYEDSVTHEPWPRTFTPKEFPGLEFQPAEDALSECNGEALVQDFRMIWSTHLFDKNSNTLRFNGLSGSFAGAEGKPGVEFNKISNEYKVDTLMTRPDGSFYIHSKDRKSTFFMIFAKPDEETGEPIKETLKVFSFSPGHGVRLEPGFWHSVPIPHASNDIVEFRETVAETNANIVANVHFESNGPLRFTAS
jgi:ureidoglycolate hydrolase